VDYTTVLTAQANAAEAALTQTQARTNLLVAIASLQVAMARWGGYSPIIKGVIQGVGYHYMRGRF